MKHGASQLSELDKEVILSGGWMDSCKYIHIYTHTHIYSLYNLFIGTVLTRKTTSFVYLTILGSRQNKPTFWPTCGDGAALKPVSYSGCLRNRVKNHNKASPVHSNDTDRAPSKHFTMSTVYYCQRASKRAPTQLFL